MADTQVFVILPIIFCMFEMLNKKGHNTNARNFVSNIADRQLSGSK